MPVITLSREMGSLGDDVAQAVAERLQQKLIGRELINRAAKEAGAPEVALAEIDELGLLGMKPSRATLRLYLEKVLLEAPPPFSHPVEVEFARILDFYGIPWAYEPHTFVLARDVQGNVTEAFSPDFYLPEQDLYIELTTMLPNQIRHKNRKIRHLRALHPEVNVKLFKRGDIRALMIKFGIDDPDMLHNAL